MGALSFRAKRSGVEESLGMPAHGEPVEPFCEAAASFPVRFVTSVRCADEPPLRTLFRTAQPDWWHRRGAGRIRRGGMVPNETK